MQSSRSHAVALRDCPSLDAWAGLADSERRDALEGHLDRCAECRSLVAALAAAQAPESLAETIPRGDAIELVAPGTRIGRYVVARVLGRGAQGVVLSAIDPALDRIVALKLIDPRSDAALLEAQAMARVAHPNVVVVYEVAAHGEHVLIAMERIDGPDLATWLRQRPSVAARIRVVCEAARGIEAAHAAGIVHRDIKPSNILVGSDGRARVSDFGLATRGGSEPGRLAGTRGYLAPEILAGGAADERSDQYSFAVTAWQVLFDAPPGTHRGGRRERRLAPPLVRALAERPEDRFPSMTVLAAALEHAARPRWPRLVVAAFALATIGFGIAWWFARGADPECTLDTAWWSERRTQLADELRGRDRSPLGSSAKLAVELLDRHAREVAAARCDLERQPAADRALRGQCVERVRRQHELVVDAITSRDVSADHAARAAVGLPSVDRCANTTELRASSSADPIAETQRHELDRAIADLAVGADAASEERLAKLAGTVASTDGALVAEVALYRAIVALRSQKLDTTLAELDVALARAEELGASGLRVRILARRLDVLYATGRIRDLQALAPIVEAALEYPHLSARDRASAHNALGGAAHATGDFVEAERHQRIAVETLAVAYGDVEVATTDMAGARANLATQLLRLGRDDEARALLEHALKTVEDVVGPTSRLAALPLLGLAQLARANPNELAKAAALYERVIGIFGDDPAVLEPLLYLADVEVRRGRRAVAIATMRRALDSGAKTPMMPYIQSKLAEQLVQDGADDEARTLLQAAVAAWDLEGVKDESATAARLLLTRLEKKRR